MTDIDITGTVTISGDTTVVACLYQHWWKSWLIKCKGGLHAKTERHWVMTEEEEDEVVGKEDEGEGND